MAITTGDRFDAYGTDNPDYREGHPEDRCPRMGCNDTLVQDHPCWRHRRAAAVAIAVAWINRKLAGR